jgi:hypothetical protein
VPWHRTAGAPSVGSGAMRVAVGTRHLDDQIACQIVDFLTVGSMIGVTVARDDIRLALGKVSREDSIGI